MRRADAGQIRLIEAFLSIFIIFSSFTIATSLTPSQSASGRGNLQSVGVQCLVALDADGSLSTCITTGNWSRMQEMLSASLPVGLSFNVTVFDEEMRQVNDVIVSNGGIAGQEVSAVEYVCACREPVFRCYVIRLCLAVAP